MRIIDILVRYLVETQYDSLSTQVVETTKKQVLDTLAASIGGSTCSINDEIGNMARYIQDKGGKPESTLIGFRGRVPAPDAAFLNGILAVRLDFDDTLVKGSKIHISRSIIPPAFAVAERKTRVSGREFLTAVALAHDLSARLRQTVGKDIDSPFGMLTNFFGATAVVSKILGLDQEYFTTALSLTFHMVSGAQSGRGTAGAGASIKGLNNGLASQTGVVSGLFAPMGFSASHDFLEPTNKKNLYNIFIRDFILRIYSQPTSARHLPVCRPARKNTPVAMDNMPRSLLQWTS
jgi:2-methylcitrate dehydratase PrpD